MKYKAHFLLSLFGILVIAESKASVIEDTTRSSKPHNITTSFTEQTVAPFHQWQKLPLIVDTTLHDLQYYTTQYNQGNTGSPYVPVVFKPEFNPLGFYYGNNYITGQLYSDSTIKYYNTRAPYTKLYYVTDPKIHQFIHAIHSQNIGKNFNFALEFQRTRSQGVYLNQGTNVNQLTLALNYHSKRYVAFANGMYGVYKLNQNGGIVNDSSVGDKAYSNRQTVPVNLSAARSIFLDKSVHLKQYLFFGFHKTDSANSAPLFYVSHSLKLGSNSNLYTDPGPLNTAYYSHIYRDSLKTYDSLHYNEVSNDISIGSGKTWPKFVRWEAGVTDQWVHFTDSRTDTIFSNLIAHACIYDTGRVLYNVQGKEVISGNRQGDMQASASIGFRIDSLRTVRVQGDYSSQAPALVNELYYGNNLMWENHFDRTTTSSASLIYCDTKWKLSLILQATQIQNLTYLNPLVIPQQYDQPINVLSAHLKKDFTVGKWHLNTDNIIQVVQDSLPLRLPRFVLENSLFYENYLFHHAMLFKIGVDVYYNSSYYGYAYMPVVDQYYVQNQTKLGDYVYIDPFVSFRVKTFRMFFRLENAGANLIGSNYFYALHSPTTDRVLRIGISWDFWN